MGLLCRFKHDRAEGDRIETRQYGMVYEYRILLREQRSANCALNFVTVL